MYLQNPANGEAPVTPRFELPPADDRRFTRLAAVFSGLVSLAMLVAVVWRLREMPVSTMRDLLPTSALFWLTFAAYYCAAPASEWFIYHRLWGLPASGIAALMRKLVSNEILLGYLGEVQFYAWVRSRLNLAAAPFGAIKDVTILSALTGNIATLAMLVLAWPLVSEGIAGIEGRTVFVSLGVVLVSSLGILLFRRKIFSLPKPELRFITVVHFIRIFGIVALAAVMWHSVLPAVGLGLWFVLATLRMLVSRLPLLPNKDVIFAGLAAFLMGRDAQIAGLMTMMAAILLVTHIIVGAAFAAVDLMSSGEQA